MFNHLDVETIAQGPSTQTPHRFKFRQDRHSMFQLQQRVPTVCLFDPRHITATTTRETIWERSAPSRFRRPSRQSVSSSCQRPRAPQTSARLLTCWCAQWPHRRQISCQFPSESGGGSRGRWSRPRRVRRNLALTFASIAAMLSIVTRMIAGDLRYERERGYSRWTGASRKQGTVCPPVTRMAWTVMFISMGVIPRLSLQNTRENQARQLQPKRKRSLGVTVDTSSARHEQC